MKFLSVSFLAIAVASSAVYADMAVTVGGEVKFKFEDIDNNVAANTVGYVASSNAFSTSADLDISALAQSGNLTYGADIEFDLDADAKTVGIEKSEVWVVTSFGRFGGGVVPVSNRSADRIAAGEGGASTDPLGREYEDKFGGPALSYGIKLGGFAAGISTNAELEPSWTVLYGGETINGASYEVYTRGTDRGEVKAEIAGAERTAASSYKTMQHGAKVKFNDWSVAGSLGQDKATDYAFLTGLATPVTNLNDDVERKYWNIGARYDMGALSVSADYDKGKITAPWADSLAGTTSTTPSTTGIFANRNTVYSDAEYTAWSVGAEYKIADGLVFGAGYKEFDNGLLLLLEASGLGTGGFKYKDQSELAASLTLTF